jgi:alginate O-acetyltransferase complex protein AlgI
MFFHSFPFLVFFAIVFTVYWSLPLQRHRMIWLLIASAAFYMSWNPWLIALLATSASLDYFLALLLERTHCETRRRLVVALSITGNLSFLFFFKYVNFFLASSSDLLTWLGFAVPRVVLDVVLPLGISFYTFEAISYIVDVSKRRIRAVRNPLDYALYMLFFPHLIAGPIVRPEEFLPQLQRSKSWNWDRMQVGVQIFLIGLFKKAILADYLALVVDPVFAEPGRFASAAHWLAVLSYAAQLYCDFSGYSDMAIGLAHLLGFKLPVNFRLPYASASIGEFWRRWHISLSSWLRDYLFIPLGGSREGTWRTYRNLLITMVLAGLWHGAGWTFALWGLYHGALLVLERACPLPAWLQWPSLRPVRVAATFLTVALGWVVFRAPTLGAAGTILRRLFQPMPGLAAEPLLAGAALCCLAMIFLGHFLGTFVDLKKLERRLSGQVLAAGLASAVVLILLLFPEDSKAFLYFQF